MIGNNTINILFGLQNYTDQKARVTDNYDPQITINGITNGNVNNIGSYRIIYNHTDLNANVANQVVRNVNLLNPDLDTDGDGFTNRQEFDAGTNYDDPLNYPDTKFKVNFDSVGGSLVEIQQVDNMQTSTRPVDPEKKGYIFVSWNLNGIPFNFATPVTSDITLVANWKIDESKKDFDYVVNYYIDETTDLVPGLSQLNGKGYIGEIVLLTHPITNQGYKFKEGQPTTITVLEDNSATLNVYYVKDEEQWINITFNEGLHGSIVEAITSFEVLKAYPLNADEQLNKVIVPTVLGELGYEFNKWSTEIILGNIYDVDTITNAEYNLKAFNVSYVLNEGINHIDNKSSFTIEMLPLKLSDPERWGFNFDGWYVDEFFDGSSLDEIPVSNFDDITLHAKWIPIIITDNTPPVIENVIISKNPTKEDNITVSGLVYDLNLKDYNLRIYDESKKLVSPWIGLTEKENKNGELGTFDISKLLDGNYFVRIWAHDTSLNSTGIVSHIYVPFTIDRTAPKVTNIVIDPYINFNTGKTVSIYFDLTDLSGVDLIKSYVMFSDGPSTTKQFKESEKMHPILVSGNRYKVEFDSTKFVLQNYVGNYNLQFTLVDILENRTSTKPIDYRGILVDNSGPSSTLTTPLNGALIRETIRFSFEVFDDTGVASGYIRFKELEKNYSLIKGDGNTWYVDIDTSLIPDGTYTLDARFVDVFGTARYGSNKGTVTIDNASPSIKYVYFKNDWEELAWSTGTSVSKPTLTMTSRFKVIENLELDFVKVIWTNEYNGVTGHTLLKNTMLNNTNLPGLTSVVKSLNDYYYTTAPSNIQGLYKLGIVVKDKAGNLRAWTKDVYFKTQEAQLAEFTVTFMDGTTILKTETVQQGNSATSPTDPSKEGFTFKGWDISFNDIQSDLTINAIWEKTQMMF